MPGLDQGVEGLKVGGKRLIRIPPSMGYGAKGSSKGTVPPNSDLEIEVELEKTSSSILADFLHQFGIGLNRKTAAILAFVGLLAISPLLS